MTTSKFVTGLAWVVSICTTILIVSMISDGAANPASITYGSKILFRWFLVADVLSITWLVAKYLV